jgi:hypothetical protein
MVVWFTTDHNMASTRAVNGCARSHAAQRPYAAVLFGLLSSDSALLTYELGEIGSTEELRPAERRGIVLVVTEFGAAPGSSSGRAMSIAPFSTVGG